MEKIMNLVSIIGKERRKNMSRQQKEDPKKPLSPNSEKYDSRSAEFKAAQDKEKQNSKSKFTE